MVTVLGTLTRASDSRPFVQTFVLAPQDPSGYFVLNYVFRSFRDGSHHDADGKPDGKRKKGGKPKADAAPAVDSAPATSAAPAPAAAEHKTAASVPAAAAVELKPAAAAAAVAAVQAPAVTPAAAPAPAAAPTPATAPAPAPAPAASGKGTFSYASAASKAPSAAAPPKPAAPKPAAAKARPAEAAAKPAAAAGNGTAGKKASSEFPSALCVKNIPFTTTEEQLQAELSKHAKVKALVMKKGFAFLDLESEEAVQKLLDSSVSHPVRISFVASACLCGVDCAWRSSSRAQDREARW